MKVWLVGAGYWGSKVRSCLDKIPAVKQVEVLDIKEGKTIDDINTKDPVILATPLWQHHEQTVELLKRGHDVYVEKPMAETSRQLLNIDRYLDNQILMVGHIFLYNPLLLKLKELIDNGELGSIQHVESRRLNWGIRQTKTTPLLSLAPHDVSIVQFLLGRIIVTHSTGSNFSNNSVPDCVEFGGNNFSIKVSWWWPKRERCVIVIGDKGQAVWDEDQKCLKVYKGYMEERYPVKELTYDNYPYTGASPLQNELEHFIKSCVNRTTPLSDWNNALSVAVVLDQAEYLLEK